MAYKILANLVIVSAANMPTTTCNIVSAPAMACTPFEVCVGVK